MSGGGSFVLSMFLLQSKHMFSPPYRHRIIPQIQLSSYHHHQYNAPIRAPPLPPCAPLKMDDLFSTRARFAFFPPPCQLFLTHWYPQTSLFLTSALEKTIRLRRGSGARGGSGSGMSPSQKSVGWLYFGVSDHVLGRKIADIFTIVFDKIIYHSPPPANLPFPLFLFPQRLPKTPFYCEPRPPPPPSAASFPPSTIPPSLSKPHPLPYFFSNLPLFHSSIPSFPEEKKSRLAARRACGLLWGLGMGTDGGGKSFGDGDER